MVGVAGVDMLPSGAHARDFADVCKFGKKSFFKIFRNWAGKHAGGVHLGISGAGETKVDDADNFVILIEQNIAEVKIAMNKFFLLSFFDVSVVGVDMVVVMFVIELVKKIRKGIFDFFGGVAEVDSA